MCFKLHALLEQTPSWTKMCLKTFCTHSKYVCFPMSAFQVCTYFFSAVPESTCHWVDFGVQIASTCTQSEKSKPMQAGRTLDLKFNSLQISGIHFLSTCFMAQVGWGETWTEKWRATGEGGLEWCKSMTFWATSFNNNWSGIRDRERPLFRP